MFVERWPFQNETKSRKQNAEAFSNLATLIVSVLIMVVGSGSAQSSELRGSVRFTFETLTSSNPWVV